MSQNKGDIKVILFKIQFLHYGIHKMEEKSFD